MKHLRTMLAAISVAATLLAFGAPAPASAADYTSDDCRNISDGAGFYDGTVVNFRMVLSRPSCPGVRYTLTVYDYDAVNMVPTTQLSSRVQAGNGSAQLFFDGLPAPDDGTPPTVCVVGTTSISKPYSGFRTSSTVIVDRAPDMGCLPLTKGGGSGGQKFR